MPEMQQDRLALDRGSVRTIDPTSGHLHVAATPISKANICPYNGSEIPRFEELGLDPRRVYQMLRDPDELAKGAETFNGKPLLSLHRPQMSSDHDHELVVGSVNNAQFKAPYLMAELAVWDAAAIAGIDSDQKRQLSSGYFYRADMTPGSYGGVKYDGVMRDIKANHVALVDEGRAGPDVMVGDTAHITQEDIDMAKSTPALARRGLLASGALTAYLKPKLAADQKFDPRTVLGGVTAKNWTASKPKIKAALDKALKDKLAADADISDVVTMLDQLDELVDELPDEGVAAAPVADPATDDDGDMMDRLKAVLEAKGMSAEDVAAVLAALKPEVTASPASPAAADVDPAKKDEEPPMKKAAMDAAITAATRLATDKAVHETIARMNAIREAERVVRPFVGELTQAMDSAAAVYRVALDAAKVDLTDVPEAAFPALVRMLPKPGTKQSASPVAVAMDAKVAAARETRFPNANRLSH